MKKFYLPFFLLAAFCLVAVSGVNAQISCDSVGVIVDDNLDAYTEGALGPQADHWSTWSGDEGGDEDGIVSAEFANSAELSLKVQGLNSNGGPTDVLLKLGDKTTGMYILEWNMYVIETVGAYYNIQQLEADPGVQFAFEVHFGADGVASLNAGTEGVKTVPYTQDEWFRVRHLIDLDNDLIYLWIGGEFVHSWTFSWLRDATTGGSVSLGAVDFFPRDDNDWFYIDDVYYAELPTAGAGQYCHMATAIDVGTHTINSIDCFGAGFTVQDDGRGNGGAWYSYTPSEDGLIKVSSCGMGADSRVWVFSGGCENLKIEAVNDDLCGINMDGAQEWASYTEALVTGGETYFIVWDNVWESDGFDFTLEFTTDLPEAGDFCQTAIAVDPGVQIIGEINGYGNVSGPIINHTGASTTNYAQSEWYSYTPSQDGKMTVSNCGLTTEDTRLWIYDGDCGIENVNLLANDDDGCEGEDAFQSLIADLDVTAGTTYYIEWDDERLNAPGFEWELSFEPAVAVTEKEFLSAFTISPNPASSDVYVKYSFSEMTDLDIRLFNSLGQMVSARNLGAVLSGSERLELEGLASGVYFVMMGDGVNTAAQRLVVE